MLDGEFVRNGEGGVLSFERRLDKPVEKVWAALTVAERVADWCGHAAEVDLRLGGVFRIVWPAGMGEMTGVIVALEPGALLEYTWFEPSVKVAAGPHLRGDRHQERNRVRRWLGRFDRGRWECGRWPADACGHGRPTPPRGRLRGEIRLSGCSETAFYTAKPTSSC